jgi:predicted P-loop ATPase
MIWAEAVVRLKSGEPWWVTDDDDVFKLEKEQRKRREDEHAWAPRIKEELRKKERLHEQSAMITMDDVLNLLSIDISKATNSTSAQIGIILREAGWDRFKKRVGRDFVNAFRPTQDRWEEIAAEAASMEGDDDE